MHSLSLRQIHIHRPGIRSDTASHQEDEVIEKIKRAQQKQCSCSVIDFLVPCSALGHIPRTPSGQEYKPQGHTADWGSSVKTGHFKSLLHTPTPFDIHREKRTSTIKGLQTMLLRAASVLGPDLGKLCDKKLMDQP